MIPFFSWFFLFFLCPMLCLTVVACGLVYFFGAQKKQSDESDEAYVRGSSHVTPGRVLTVSAVLYAIAILVIGLVNSLITQLNSLSESAGTGSGSWLCGRIFRRKGKVFLPRVCGVESQKSSWIFLYNFNEMGDELQKDPSVKAALPQILRMAKEEYASIATFSRLNLELLSMGAPARLIEASTKAIGEEIHHSKFMFGFYSWLSGVNYAPDRADEFIDTLSPLAKIKILEDRYYYLSRDALIEGAWNEGINASYIEILTDYAKVGFPEESFRRLAYEEKEHFRFALELCSWAVGEGLVSVGKLAKDLTYAYSNLSPWPQLETLVRFADLCHFRNKLEAAKMEHYNFLQDFLRKLPSEKQKCETRSKFWPYGRWRDLRIRFIS